MRVSREIVNRMTGPGLAVLLGLSGWTAASAMTSNSWPVAPAGTTDAAAPAAQAAQTAKPRTLMAIFAHPDDEQVASTALARYAREGVRVILVIATDGRNGANDFAKIPAGDALAKARAGEAACAAQKLKIEPPILLGLHDGTALVPGAAGGAAVGSAINNHDRLAGEVTRLFAEHKPDVVITWGPDGGTGHTDHRLVSAIVTQAYQRGGKPGEPWPRQLYYAGIPAERLAKMPAEVRLFGVATQYLTVRVSYTEADFQAARESLACHRSQYTPEQAEGMMQMSKALGAGTAYFRPWTGGAAVSDDLFKEN